MADGGVEANVLRHAGISYLHIPAEDPRQAAAFYRAVFGWQVDLDRPEPSFRDGTGHVIGHFVTGSAVAGEAGIRPYVCVSRVDEVLAKVTANGGAVVKGPYPEGNLLVALFRDPEGNVLGVWQVGSP